VKKNVVEWIDLCEWAGTVQSTWWYKLFSFFDRRVKPARKKIDYTLAQWSPEFVAAVKKTEREPVLFNSIKTKIDEILDDELYSEVVENIKKPTVGRKNS
jgi:hypothetical protein